MSRLWVSATDFLNRGRARARFEEDLVFALEGFATQLDAGLSFEDCLGKEPAFSQIAREAGAGASIPEALQHFAKINDAPFVRKAAALLADIYVRGGSGAALKKLAEEQAVIQNSRLKEYNEKLTMFSLAFVMAAAVVPALFQGIVVVGSSFMPLPLSPAAAFAIPVIGFPMLTTMMFLFIISQRP